MPNLSVASGAWLQARLKGVSCFSFSGLVLSQSDVLHTMQHWQVYQKWNKRFFHECYHAYQEGQADKDPAER